MTRCLMQGICFVHNEDCPMQTAGAIRTSRIRQLTSKIILETVGGW